MRAIFYYLNLLAYGLFITWISRNNNKYVIYYFNCSGIKKIEAQIRGNYLIIEGDTEFLIQARRNIVIDAVRICAVVEVVRSVYLEMENSYSKLHATKARNIFNRKL